MKLPRTMPSSIGTAGATGITLMTLHITGFLTGWAWPILYVFLIIAGVGLETRGSKND
jgi:hypothetical protein